MSRAIFAWLKISLANDVFPPYQYTYLFLLFLSNGLEMFRLKDK